MRSALAYPLKRGLLRSIRGTNYTAENMTFDDLIERWRKFWSDWSKDFGKWKPSKLPTPSALA